MERPNQPPKPECGRQPGQATHPTEGSEAERTAGGKHKETHGPQTGVASGLSNPASKHSMQTGRGSAPTEPKTSMSANGEGMPGLPGSKSGARAENVKRNLGGPTDSRPTNYGYEAGRGRQRQGAGSEGTSGFRSVHSSQKQGPHGPDPGEGADIATQPAQDTRTVRTTDSRWRTTLRAITTKAVQQPTYRFGGLYRLLNEETLRECFYALRKAAAPGVDGVTFQAYAKNLEANLSDLVRRLKHKSYHARLVRRKEGGCTT